MAARPKRERTIRREAARRAVRDAGDRERLFRREPGGSPERPVDVESTAVVEVRAQALPCPLCGGEQRVDEHLATTVSGDRLREVRLRCRRCGSRRSTWFRLPVVN